MIVLRNKLYSVPKPGEMRTPKQQQGTGQNNSQITSMRDLQAAQMRLQRQQILIQHQKQQLLAKNEMQKRRALLQRQKIAADEEISDNKDRIKVRQMESQENNKDNTSLYKTKSRPVQPVPMKV